MKKKYSYKEVSNVKFCQYPGCNRPLKSNLLYKKANAKYCYFHWCLLDTNESRPMGRNPRARKENRLNKKRRFERILKK
jgi:hypothetical protein